MTLKEYAELNNITLADAKKRTGLSHWKQEVVEAALDALDLPISEEAEEVIEEAAVEVLEIVEEAVFDVAEVIVEAVVDLTSRKERLNSIKGLGTKSKYWSEFNG